MSMGRTLRKADLCKTGLYQYAIYPPEAYICNDLCYEPVGDVYRAAEVN